MAKEHSMDISSKVDKGELKNAIYQVEKEIGNRFDFKGVFTEIKDEGSQITITSDSDNRCESIFEVLIAKVVKRGLAPTSLKKGDSKSVGGNKTKLEISVNDTLDMESAKKIVALIKKSKTKVTPSIQGDSVRVKGKSIDDLQQIIAEVKAMDLELPLVFDNFK